MKVSKNFDLWTQVRMCEFYRNNLRPSLCSDMIISQIKTTNSSNSTFLCFHGNRCRCCNKQTEVQSFSFSGVTSYSGTAVNVVETRTEMTPSQWSWRHSVSHAASEWTHLINNQPNQNKQTHSFLFIAMTSQSHLGARQVEVSGLLNPLPNPLLLLLFRRWSFLRSPETSKRGADGKPPEPASPPDHVHPHGEVIWGIGGRGRGGALPLDEASLLLGTWRQEESPSLTFSHLAHKVTK